MQKALENQHYKKIWEKVMMNRHPEVKSLEEALINEKQYFDCCFSYNDITSYVGSMCDNLKIDIQAYNGMAEEYFEQLSWQKKAAFLANFETKYTLLGRPITLEDILILLKGYFAGIHVDINGIFKLNGIGQPADWSIIGWNFTKPLHEQNTEVLENISKLID